MGKGGFSEEDLAKFEANLERGRQRSVRGSSGVADPGRPGGPGPVAADSLPPVLKYKNKRTKYNDRFYDSYAEACRARVLDLLLLAGQIRKWKAQPRYVLRPARVHPEFVLKEEEDDLIYVADFLVYALPGQDDWVEDVKGYIKPKDRKVWKRWRQSGRFDLHIIFKSGTDVIPGGLKNADAKV